MRRIIAVLAGLFLLLGSGALTACGGEREAGASGGGLRVGYQRFGGLSLLKARNAAPPGTRWSLFESGPALTEALKAGSVDIGQVGEAPPIFAAAGRVDFKIIGTSAPVPRGEAVLVKESRGFRSFKDLRGRTIGLNKGSNVHWLLLRLLEANGMAAKDVQVRYLKPAEGRPAFDNDRIDAWVIWDPYFALAERPGVKILADASGLANNREYVLVSPKALKDKPDQLTGFLRQYRQVTDWGLANPAERVRILAPELKIPEDPTRRALARSAQPLAPVDAAVGAELQRIADGFTALELIPGKVDMRARLDERYSGIFR
ncbi:aliphatic sulfonate ABC transporter substrate-binding protein [Actinomadura sp. NEAU-AAG7]|uniref:aliphatic sulfonate ABC transporter substrate-binding protein n=1 Tax=Actinomadura sp. NEAU-AAG7 TaxID=2839640 RepID=UPI001BE40259|nr:aliphatic sulfonate ABC transporter substrate-binding protein [Actinomadura sp. NEAU-AAG7]MBT2212637.1 aliphatic sulfonate ABC transporter substrate-binding protein [Actinomadura sp. NEAU-AAG7]